MACLSYLEEAWTKMDLIEFLKVYDSDEEARGLDSMPFFDSRMVRAELALVYKTLGPLNLTESLTSDQAKAIIGSYIMGRTIGMTLGTGEAEAIRIYSAATLHRQKGTKKG